MHFEPEEPLVITGNYPHALLAGQIRQRLAECLPTQRLIHVLGVEGLAVALAAQWGISTTDAMLAALLHDVAKNLPREEQETLMRDAPLYEAAEEDEGHPALWHGPAAATIASREYGIDNPDILEAVAYHTTGKPGLGGIGLAIYVADYLEPTRNQQDVSRLRRELLHVPPRDAALGVARHKLEHIRKHRREPHSRTVAMADWLDNSLAGAKKGT